MRDVRVAGSKLEHYHICALFRSREEEYSVLQSFIQDGIHDGDKTIHICDPKLRRDHLDQLASLGVPVADCQRSGQLEVFSWDETYLKQGRFDPDTMLALLEEVVRTTRAEGFSRVRMLGHMEWALDEKPGVEHLIEYEAKANLLLNRLQQPAICVFDTTRFGGTTMVDVLRTHPFVIVDGALRESPFYVPPERLLGLS